MPKTGYFTATNRGYKVFRKPSYTHLSSSSFFGYSRENKLDHIVTLKRGKVEEIDMDLKQVALH
jgi:hypothetical protein